MIQLELSAKELEILLEILDTDLSDLRMEIADTDRMDFREMLKTRKAVIAKVLTTLREARGSAQAG